MIVLRGSLVVGALAVVLAGCGGTGRAHHAGSRTQTGLTSATTSETGPALESSRASPCGSVNLPVTWSPDGKQIAWYGYRWPLPHLHHRSPSVSVLRAICISDADGKNLRPLRSTVCSEHCSRAMSEGADQLEWVGPNLLLYGNDLGIFGISLGSKPRLVAKKPPAPFVVDSAGDRVAAGAVTGCADPGCAGPVTVLAVPSGRIVGKAGGSKLDNVEPSLSPDGTQVVFVRTSTNGSVQTKGIWTAAADGSHLQQLEPSGDRPLWSPAGNRIAYVARSGPLRVVAPQGGASTTLVRTAPGTVFPFGWSPDGRQIAFSDESGKLAVIDVGTRKVRTLLQLYPPYGPSSIAWSPDSRQLLVVWQSPAHSGCPNGLWRVPVDGAKPRLVHGC